MTDQQESSSPPAPRPGQLVVVADGDERRFPPGTGVVIGRAADCDVVLTDPLVSRRHVELVHEEGWFIHDLDTENGTWHGGTPLTTHPVGPGLSVRLGDPVGGPLVELIAVPDDPGSHETRDLGRDLDAAPGEPAGAGGPAGSRGPVPLGGRLTIGRALGNDLVLDDPLVSRRHARIDATPDGQLVQDLGSANLTFVNGTQITVASLGDGDVLTCGQTRMVRVGERLHLLPGGSDTGLVVDDLVHAAPPARPDDELEAVMDAAPLTSGLSFRVKGRSLLAVIGPAGAGKSTLLRLLAGDLLPSGGRVRYQSQDVHVNASVRTRIGLVPRYPVVHQSLTARQVLRQVAELRLPRDETRAEYQARVQEVLAEVGLTEDADVRVDRLREDRPRRLSIAVELLTDPSLLLLDEPTEGLDPARARAMMLLLRRLADAGRQVVFATRDPAALTVCDTVLVLAPGGQKAYDGPPGGVARRFGTVDWAIIFERLSQVSTARAGALPGTALSDAVTPGALTGTALRLLDVLRDPGVRRRALHQTAVVARRQLRLLVAEPRHTALLTLLPVLVALCAVAVSDAGGLSVPPPGGSGTAPLALVVLIGGIAVMAMLAPLRDLAGERRIYHHERAAGLLPEAYLAAKSLVFCGITVAQALLMLFVVRVARPGPGDAVLLGWPTLEIALAFAATAAACCCLGLAISAWVPVKEHTILPLVVAVMAQLLLCGGLVPLPDRPHLIVPALLTPARWGYGAVAITVDLRRQGPDVPDDTLWTHEPQVWLGCLIMLAVLGATGLALALWRLRH